ncbi:MAG: hypothetical protein ACI4SS_01735 [Clostridia bacterium]
MSRKYDITMQTPIGERFGHACINKKDGIINGYIELLNHIEPFLGNVDVNGNCSISGYIVTEIRTLYYTAEGRLVDDAIDMAVSCEGNLLTIKGTPAQA